MWREQWGPCGLPLGLAVLVAVGARPRRMEEDGRGLSEHWGEVQTWGLGDGDGGLSATGDTAQTGRCPGLESWAEAGGELHC